MSVGFAMLSGCAAPKPITARPDPDGGLDAREAPMLTRLVRAGKLPPVQQRVPSDPLVVKPLERDGLYGGTWHMMVDAPDLGVYKMIAGYAPLMRWKPDCSGLDPGTAYAWEYNRDGTQLTLHLRHGIRWSDGVEFTSEDIAYWAQLCHEAKQKLQTPFWSLVDGKEMTVTTPDKYTVVMHFAGPNWYVPLHLATGYWWSEQYNLPKHYMMRFDPHFNPKYKDYNLFDKRNSTEFNPDRPTLWPWRLARIEEAGFRTVWERNPYYFAVDDRGRQLPYIDRIITTYVPNDQVRVLKILSGEIDAQFRLVELKDLALYLQGRRRGDYRVLRWKEANGGSDSWLVNWSTPDPVKRELFRMTPFRQALSLAVDRDKCNQVGWRGLGTPQQATVSREGWHFQTAEGKAVFDEWAKSYAEFDLPRANRLLDSIGLAKRDSEGYRVMKDGRRLSILIDLGPQNTTDYTGDEALIVADGWRKLGIDVTLHNWPSAEMELRRNTGKYEVSPFGESEMDLFTYPDWVFPTSDKYWHIQTGKWYKTSGKEGEAPTGPVKRLVDLYAKIMGQKDLAKAHRLVQDAVRVHMQDGPFVIGTVGDLPSLVIVKSNLRNVPESDRILGPWAVSGPASSFPETFFFAPQGASADTERVASR